MPGTDIHLERAYIALGSNAGNRLELLESACDLLAETFGSLRLSQVYETEPVGCPEGSPPFLNACVGVETNMSPLEILHRCQEIEQVLGRRRNGVYGAPRTCDLDLICVGQQQVNTCELILPHPRAHLRAFVLYPLCDIDPMLTLPGQTQTVTELKENLPADGPVVTPYPL